MGGHSEFNRSQEVIKMLNKEKSTDELMNEIKQTREIDSFLNNNDSELLTEPLHVVLNKLLEENGLKKAKVVARSGLNRVYCYQIFLGKRNPSRDKLIAICFGFQFDLKNTDTLLKIAGFSPLYARNKRDAVIIFAINSKKSIFGVNELLFDGGFDILTA